MKKRKYLHCTIITHDGTVVKNPLKLGEVVLVSKIVKENKSVNIRLETCTEAQYKSIFG